MTPPNDMIGKHPCQDQMEIALRYHGWKQLSSNEISARMSMNQKPVMYGGEYISTVKSYDKFDYKVRYGDGTYALVDCKDKNKFVPENWGIPEDEKHLWQVFDETAVRKLVNGGKNYFFIMHDYNTESLYVWTSMHIALGHRRWAVRNINLRTQKHKLLYHVLSTALITESWIEVLDFMRDWVKHNAYNLASDVNQTLYDPDLDGDIARNNQQRDSKYYTEDIGNMGGSEYA